MMGMCSLEQNFKFRYGAVGVSVMCPMTDTVRLGMKRKLPGVEEASRIGCVGIKQAGQRNGKHV